MRSFVVWLGLVACSAPARSNVSDAPEGGDVGTGSDAASDAVPLDVVTVTVNSRTDLGVVIPNAPVVFIDPDQTVTYAHTDGTGTAQASVHPGASVTVIYAPDTVEYMTVLDVQPGDHLVFGGGGFVNIAPMTVTFTAYSDPSATYLFQCACGPKVVTPGTTTLTYSDCLAPTVNTDAYVVASVGGTVVATASLHDIDLSLPIVLPEVWAPAATLQVSYTGAPGRITSTFLDAPQGFLLQTSLDTSPYEATLKVPVDGVKQFVRTNFEIGSAPESIWEKLAPGATTYHLDFSSHVLPAISGVTYDRASRTVSTQSTPVLPNSLVVYAVTWGDSTNPYTWEILTHTLAPATFPTLPPDLEDLAMYAGGSPTMLIVATPALTDWDQVRANMTELLNGPRSLAFDFFQSELVGL